MESSSVEIEKRLREKMDACGIWTGTPEYARVMRCAMDAAIACATRPEAKASPEQAAEQVVRAYLAARRLLVSELRGSDPAPPASGAPETAA